MAIITVKLEVDETKLWEATFGCSPFQQSWWRKVKFLDGADWEHPGRVQLSITDPDDEDKVVTKILWMPDLLRAYGWLIENPKYHCFGHRVCQDIEDFDACEGDTLLQVAMLGDEVYA